MNRNKIFIILLLFYTLPLAALIKTGVRAPYFQVTDGNNRTLYSTDLQGRVIIGFYESRDTSEKNNALKDELNSFRSGAAGTVKQKTFRLAVIDASSANIATSWAWRKNMKKKSAELGIHIYGDWNGKMKRDFSFPENESVFIIIDRKNIVRYTCAGKVPETEFVKIKNLIKKIFSE